MAESSTAPRRTLLKYTLTVLAVLAVLGVPLLVADIMSVRSLVPTGQAATLSDFLEWQPSAERFALFELDARQHIIIYGPSNRMLYSGPPAYVFDETGSLIDWSTDIGDDSRFCESWDTQVAATVDRHALESLAEAWPERH